MPLAGLRAGVHLWLFDDLRAMLHVDAHLRALILVNRMAHAQAAQRALTLLRRSRHAGQWQCGKNYREHRQLAASLH